MSTMYSIGAEQQRLLDDIGRMSKVTGRGVNWKRWGPYLSERQWGTVREDYSADGSCWTYFPHEHAQSRAYRWGEDGLLGITDRECRLCFAVALWNGKDPLLKERLFGLTGSQGNHGEDVKEEYFYLDSTPTHSYLKALYKYPQREFPYQKLIEENAKRTRQDREYELRDTGVFEGGRYFDVFVEYAKADDQDILVRWTVMNRGPEEAECHLLPTVWFRNTWSWGCGYEGCWIKPWMGLRNPTEEGGGGNVSEQPAIEIETDHVSLGKFAVFLDRASDGTLPTPMFTENHTNHERLYGSENLTRHVKDAFHDRVISNITAAVNPANTGTKCAGWYRLKIPAGGTVVVKARIVQSENREKVLTEGVFGKLFDQVFVDRIREADEFYEYGRLGDMSDQERAIIRQAYAGLLWSKQFYHYVVAEWLDGDPTQPEPPRSRKNGRNSEWRHLFNRDVISMPDKWEYPWYAVWDLAFHCVAFAKIDGKFAKDQLLLMLREWYMHPSGAIPAYEFAFGDVNPPVHAWACWRVYKMTGKKGSRDRLFLERAFHKLLLNFTWWVNRKDPNGRNIFGGGFLGLDNIGIFDRSRPLTIGGKDGWTLEQADGTAWMAFYCGTMLSMAIELAQQNPAYEDVASKFFEHFVAIVDAMNTLDGSGLWDEHDGFYYDHIRLDHTSQALKVRSLVGVIPMIAVEVLEQKEIDRLPGFKKRMEWFLENRKDLCRHVTYMAKEEDESHGHRLLAVPSRERLESVLRYLFDEHEFLSPHGVRSVSRFHQSHPYVLHVDEQEYRVDYSPAESTTALFGGNSNWRGPVWFPINFLLIEALERYHHFYGTSLKVHLPTRSGPMVTLDEAAAELRRRMIALFMTDESGRRPSTGSDERYVNDPHWKDLLLFHEYFHADTGEGLGASHQTGWTALVAPMLRDEVKRRTSSIIKWPE